MLNSIYTVMVNNRKIIVVINGGSNSRRSSISAIAKSRCCGSIVVGNVV